MGTEEKYSPDITSKKAAILEKKAGMLFGDKERFSPEEYSEASAHLNEMLEKYGTIERVADALEFEELLSSLDLEKEFSEALQYSRQSHELINEAKEKLSHLAYDLIKDCPGITQLEIQQKLFEEAKKIEFDFFLRKIFSFPKIRALSQNADYQRVIHIYQSLVLAGPDKPPQKQGDEGWPSQFKNDEPENLLTSASAAPPPPSPPTPGKNPEPPVAKPKPRPENIQLMAAAAPSPPPPPPGGPGKEPKKYSEITPDNLVEIEWPNGDKLVIEPAVAWTDAKGRKRQFYFVKLVYTPKGQSKKVTVDLSHYVPGKEIIFEGAKGSFLGAALEPEERKEFENVRGIAADIGDSAKNLPYLIALDVQRLQQSELSLATVFHEIGHVFLFGPDEDLMPEKNRWLTSLKKSSNNIKQIKKYPPVFERIAVENQEYISKLNKMIDKIVSKSQMRLLAIKKTPDDTEQDNSEESKLLDELKIQLKAARILEQVAKGQRINREQYRTMLNQPVFNQLWDIFHERNARAFSIRQIRKLGLDKEYSSGQFLEHQMGSLENQAKIDNNPYLQIGPKGFS